MIQFYQFLINIEDFQGIKMVGLLAWFFFFLNFAFMVLKFEARGLLKRLNVVSSMWILMCTIYICLSVDGLSLKLAKQSSFSVSPKICIRPGSNPATACTCP